MARTCRVYMSRLGSSYGALRGGGRVGGILVAFHDPMTTVRRLVETSVVQMVTLSELSQFAASDVCRCRDSLKRIR